MAVSGCVLCPRACGVNRAAGERGVCGAAEELLVAHIMLHEWEEPPLSPGAGSGAVFFPGCSLRCAYCQNHAISRKAQGTPMTVLELADAFLRLQQQGAANVNLVTPTHFAHEIRQAVALARERGLELPVIWNTSGYETAEAIAANDGIVDVYLTDLKYVDPRLAARLSQAADYPAVALAAIHEMQQRSGPPAFDVIAGEVRMTKGVVVRHLVLPGQVGASQQVLDVLWREFGDQVKLSIMSQYTPQIPAGSPVLDEFSELTRRVTEDEYEAVLDHADALGFEDYFWQQGDPAQDSFIPPFHQE